MTFSTTDRLSAIEQCLEVDRILIISNRVFTGYPTSQSVV